MKRKIIKRKYLTWLRNARNKRLVLFYLNKIHNIHEISGLLSNLNLNKME